jgi:cell division protein FtsZ
VFKDDFKNRADEEYSLQKLGRKLFLGVGEAGCNVVSKLMEMGMVEAMCVAVSGDALQLNVTKAHKKILIGGKSHRGLEVKIGTENDEALRESIETLEGLIADSDIVFVAADLSNGKYAGDLMVMTETAKAKSVLTVGIALVPSNSEMMRAEYAAYALTEMRRNCDMLIVIDEERLIQLTPSLSRNEAYNFACKFLAEVIKNLMETISAQSLVNVNFQGLKTLFTRWGVAVIGVGDAQGPNRAEEAVRKALKNLSFDVNLACAKAAIVHITGDRPTDLEEANLVEKIFMEYMGEDALVAWGFKVNPKEGDKLKVTLVLTGIYSAPILSMLGTLAPQLYNMDPQAEPERPLGTELNLYQMEQNLLTSHL